MQNDLLLVHTTIAIVGIIALIVVLKVHPMFSLIAGVLYLGIASGIGLTVTLETLTEGFGDILADIGLLIAFGIVMGAALAELGVIDRTVTAMVRVFGKRRSPYALGLTAGTALQPIFADVMLVVTAPVARGLARTIGPNGIPRMVSALVTGILVGLTMMIPSVGSLALAGVIEIPLWRYLIFGALTGVVTIIVTIFVMNVLIDRTPLWNAAADADLATFYALDGLDVPEGAGQGGATSAPADGPAGGGAAPSAADRPQGSGADPGTQTLPGRLQEQATPEPRPVPVLLAGAPVVVALLLVASGSLSDLFGVENELLDFLTAPTMALLVGAFAAVLLVRGYRGQTGVDRALKTSFSSLGEVLVLTGLGGALAGLVRATGLDAVLGDFFASSAGPPILLAWFIAVVLHVAIGSVSVAAITAASILGPVASSAGVDPILVALAAAAGSLFLMTVHSNFFWMSKNLLGQATSGAVKIVGMATSVASVVGLGAVLLLSLFL